MPLQPPQLDTLNFDAIKRRILLRIPRYTPEWKDAPEWNDFNESDPGVTLVELFAWLTEMMGYQMNQVPERNYLKFLQLLGMELRPAKPAVAHLTFTPQPGAATGSVPMRAQVSAQPAGGGNPLIFETMAGLDLIRLPLERVLVFDNGSFSDVTAANAVSSKTSFRPFGWAPQPGNALYLGFSMDPQKPPPLPYFPQEMRFRVFLPPESQAGQPDACRSANAPAAPPVKLVWEYRQRESPPRWTRLAVYKDESAGFTREGEVQVQGPGPDFVPAVAGMGQDKLYWLRVRLDAGSFPAGKTPTIDFIRPNVVAAENLSTIQQELVGTSQGTPRQDFTLQHSPVQVDSLILTVSETNQPAANWNRKEDFLASGPDDTDYVLNATTGKITFGDGRKGLIPVAGSQIVATIYRYGGGSAGNVADNSITALTTNVQGVQGVTNERPATGGRDEQTIDDFKNQAPCVLRHRNRAVSEDDYAKLATETGGIAKAKAIALAHPDYPGVVVPGVVTVVVVPDNEDVPPKPSQEQLDRVCEYLESRRLLTVELYTRGPEYHAIKVQVRVEAEPYAAFDDVARQINTALIVYLSPLGRKPKGAPANWQPGSDFGRSLFPTSLYNAILDVDQVKAVRDLALTVDGVPHQNLNEPVKVPSWGMVYGVEQHDILVEPFNPGS